MIRAQQTIDRLQADANVMAVLKLIGKGSDIPSTVDQIQTSPAGYVGECFDERAQPSTAGTMVTRQKVTATFAVLLLFQGIGPAGTAQDDNIIAAREAVKASLIGWTPDSDVSDPIEFVDDGTVQFSTDEDVLVYRVRFSSSYTVRGISE